MTKLCPVDQRGLGSGGPAGTICGREVPFGGYRTVKNAEEMYAIDRALWDVTAYLEAADGIQPTKGVQGLPRRRCRLRVDLPPDR
jgi:hypothetical protein